MLAAIDNYRTERERQSDNNATWVGVIYNVDIERSPGVVLYYAEFSLSMNFTNSGFTFVFGFYLLYLLRTLLRIDDDDDDNNVVYQ